MTKSDRDTYVLNLSENMQDLIIKNAHAKINELSALIEKRMPEFEKEKTFFEEAQAAFEKIKKEIDSMSDDIRSQEAIINVFSNYKISSSSQIRGILQDAGASTYESPKRVKWIDEAVKIFEDKKIFLSYDELWAELGKNQEIVERANQTKTGFKNLKAAVFNNIYTHSQNVNSQRGHFISLYHEKFGLSQWLNDKGHLRDPAHAKEFMFNDPHQALHVATQKPQLPEETYRIPVEKEIKRHETVTVAKKRAVVKRRK